MDFSAANRFRSAQTHEYFFIETNWISTIAKLVKRVTKAMLWLQGKIVKMDFQKQEVNVLILFEVKTDPDEQNKFSCTFFIRPV